MSKQEKKIVQERVKVPAYGDNKIEEAKGKFYFYFHKLDCWPFSLCIGHLEQVKRSTE